MSNAGEVPQPGRDAARESDGRLDSFLGLFEQFVGQFVDSARSLSRDEDTGDLVNAAGEAMRAQARELATLIRDEFGRASVRKRADIGMALRVQAADVLAGAALRAAVPAPSAERLLGLSDLFREIKKILRKLLELLFGSLPEWVGTVLDLLDELLAVIIKIFFPGLARTLSQREVDYHRELYEMRRLQLLELSQGRRDDDDDG